MLFSHFSQLSSMMSLNSLRGRILRENLVQSYLTVCLKLHTNVCRVTKDYKHYAMPALSAETVCRIITLKPLVVSGTRTQNVMPKAGMEFRAASTSKERLVPGWLE